MARKKATYNETPAPRNPSLIVPREQAMEKITTQIQKGKLILDTKIGNQSDLKAAETEKDKWFSYTFELLKRLFDDPIISKEFGSANYTPMIVGSTSFRQDVSDFFSGMEYYINSLDSIKDRLELFPEPPIGRIDVESTPTNNISNSRRIFIVHGHDNETKETVARFSEKLGLETIILHEQPNGGKTIIEKFEKHAEVGYAIVLLTPDDEGYPTGKPEQVQSRARQNVILELGYFMGILGRNRVCALVKENVEIPSDFQGVLYIPIDNYGAWKLLLAKEIKEAGIEIDLNKAL